MKTQLIYDLTKDMLIESIEPMKKNIAKAINSGAIDIDSWDENINKMIIPKCILITVLENMADQHKATGTSFEKQVKKEVKNLKYFI